MLATKASGSDVDVLGGGLAIKAEQVVHHSREKPTVGFYSFVVHLCGAALGASSGDPAVLPEQVQAGVDAQGDQLRLHQDDRRAAQV